MNDRCRLFVYGTLMRGQPGHAHLGEAVFLGPHRSEPRFRMLVVSWYPAIIDGDQSIEGEVFEVSRRQLEALDAYEGDEYARQTLCTPWGPAYIYVANIADKGLSEVPSGRWLDAEPARRKR